MSVPPPRRPIVVLASLLAVVSVLVGCGGDDDPQPAAATWRNVTVDLPDDWYLVEDEVNHFSIASHDLRAVDDEGEPIRPEGDVVGMFFTYEPGVIPDRWREWVAEQDGTIESDLSMTVGEETPATRLVFSYESNGVPTREMVIVIPSRHIVVLAQPIPGPGDTDAPEVFLDHIDTFVEVLETAEFGAPVIDED